MQGAIISQFKPVRTLLRQMIEFFDSEIAVIEASDTDNIESVVLKHAPAFLFTSIPTATDGGLQKIVRIKSDFPNLVLVVMVRYDFPEYVTTSKSMGIDDIVFEENMNRQDIERIVEKAKARC